MNKEDFAFIGCRLLAVYIAVTQSFHVVGHVIVMVTTHNSAYPENNPLQYSFYIQTAINGLYFLGAILLWKYARKFSGILLK